MLDVIRPGFSEYGRSNDLLVDEQVEDGTNLTLRSELFGFRDGYLSWPHVRADPSKPGPSAEIRQHEWSSETSGGKCKKTSAG
jgi:hypothetical protein